MCGKQSDEKQSSCEQISQIVLEKSFSTPNHLYGKQLSHEKQSLCEQNARIAVEKSSMPNRSLCDNSQTQKVHLQASEINDINNPVVSESEEINVQSKSLKLFYL